MSSTSASIWQNRDVKLLVGGATVNSTGDWLLELALPLYVFSETRSGLATSAVYIVGQLVSAFFGPLGGRMADTLRLKTTLVVTNLLQVISLLPLLIVTSSRIWPLFVVVVLQGLIRAVNDPAGFALIPRLVFENQLIAANSALTAGNSISRLVGAAAGGFAIEFGGMITVVIADGATFLFGALTAWLLSARADQHGGDGDAEPVDTSVSAGVRELRRVPGMLGMFSVQGLSALVYGGFPVLFIVFITDVVGGSESDVGLVRACAAIGGLAGAAIVGSVTARVAPARLMSFAFLLFGVLASSFVNAPPFTTALWVYMILYGSTGFPNAAAGVGMGATVQQICPAHVLGRAGGVSSAIFTSGMAVGSLLAGVGLEYATSRVLLNIQAAALFVCGLIGLVFVAGRVSTDVAR